MKLLILAVILVIGLNLLLLLFHNWRYGVWLLFLWLCLEGVVKKLLPQNFAGIIVLAKDFLIILIYLSLAYHYLYKKEKFLRVKLPSLLLLTFFIFVIYSLLEVFNPELPGLIVGIFGLKVYFFYMPLFLVGFYLFRNEKEMVHSLRTLMVSAIPLTLYAIYQMATGDVSAGYDLEEYGFQYRTRSMGGIEVIMPTSTFSGFGRFSRYMIFILCLGFGLYFLPAHGKKFRWLILSIVFAVIGILISGRRVQIFAGIIFLIIFFLLPQFTLLKTRVHGLRTIKRSAASIVILLSILTMIGVTSLMMLAPEKTIAVGEFYFKSFSGESEVLTERVYLRPIYGMLEAVYHAGLFGHGLGIVSQGVTYLNLEIHRLWEYATPLSYEVGVAKVIFELGVVGTIIFLIFRFTLLKAVFEQYRFFKTTTYAKFALAIFGYHVVYLINFYKTFSYLDDPFSNIYLWFITGVLFGLVRFKNQEETA